MLCFVSLVSPSCVSASFERVGSTMFMDALRYVIILSFRFVRPPPCMTEHHTLTREVLSCMTNRW